jgi:hypothetical protein
VALLGLCPCCLPATQAAARLLLARAALQPLARPANPARPAPSPPPPAPTLPAPPPSYYTSYGSVTLTPKDMPVQVAAWENTDRIPLFDVPTAEALTGALHVCAYECFFSRWSDPQRAAQSSCLLVQPTLKESSSHSYCYGAGGPLGAAGRRATSGWPPARNEQGSQGHFKCLARRGKKTWPIPMCGCTKAAPLRSNPRQPTHHRLPHGRLHDPPMTAAAAFEAQAAARAPRPRGAARPPQAGGARTIGCHAVESRA